MADDPDIGRCDLCGSEEGDRHQVPWDNALTAWACDNCASVPVNETDLDWWENRGGPD